MKIVYVSLRQRKEATACIIGEKSRVNWRKWWKIQIHSCNIKDKYWLSIDKKENVVSSMCIRNQHVLRYSFSHLDNVLSSVRLYSITPYETKMGRTAANSIKKNGNMTEHSVTHCINKYPFKSDKRSKNLSFSFHCYPATHRYTHSDIQGHSLTLRIHRM